MAAEPSIPGFELPDLCRPYAVLLVTLLGLLLALLLTLAASTDFDAFFAELALRAIFIETVILASAALICSLSAPLARLGSGGMAAAVFLLIQAVVLLTAWLGQLLFPAALPPASSGIPGLLRILLISMIASLVFVRYLALYRQWQQRVRAESAARLEALQARIRPHFLFNSLNTIASLIRTRPQEAEQAVLDLSDLLRAGLRADARHALAEELEIVRGYLRLEGQRLGERLRIDWRVAEDVALEQPIPALLLQPLVENAIVHGIARLPDGGTVGFRVDPDGKGAWKATVTNPMQPEHGGGDSDTANRHGLALENIRQRLELAYPEGGRLETRAENGEFFAEIRLPVER